MDVGLLHVWSAWLQAGSGEVDVLTAGQVVLAAGSLEGFECGLSLPVADVHVAAMDL